MRHSSPAEAESPKGRRLPWRRWTLVAVTCALVAGGLAAGIDDDGGGDASPRSADAERVPKPDPVGSYRVVYRIDEQDDAREETLTVRRPYESRRMSVRAGGAPNETIANDQGLWQYVADPAPGWQLIDAGRRRAEADAQPLGALPVLLEARLAELRPDGVVLGRPCTAFRVREPVGSPAVLAPTDADHVDLCVDRTGVVLREEWVLDGRVARRQEAVSLELGVEPAADAFAAEPRLPSTGAGHSGRRPMPYTDAMERSLDAGFRLPSGITADGARVTLFTGAAGEPVGGTVVRFFRSGSGLVDVEELESHLVGGERTIPHKVPTGDGVLESDLRVLTLKIELPRGITVVLRGPDVGTLDAMAGAMELRDRPTAGVTP